VIPQEWGRKAIHDNPPKSIHPCNTKQLYIREGLLAFREKGNEAILKELRQLHKQKALLPVRKGNMTYDKRKRALRYIMFLKENVTAQLRHVDALMEGHNMNR